MNTFLQRTLNYISRQNFKTVYMKKKYEKGPFVHFYNIKYKNNVIFSNISKTVGPRERLHEYFFVVLTKLHKKQKFQGSIYRKTYEKVLS